MREMKQSAYTERPIWAWQSVGVRRRIEGASGESEDATYDTPQIVVGEFEKLSQDEVVSTGYTADEEVIRLKIIASPFTLGIGIGWHLEITGATYDVKKVERVGQFHATIEALRLRNQ